MYTINIVSENKPGVLYRIIGLLTKRKINIENLSAYETKKPGVSQITITADLNPAVVDTIVKQIDRIIEIMNITYHVAHR